MNPNIDINKLRNGDYQLSDVLLVENSLGKHKEYEVYVKHGKYGHYLEWNKTTVSIPSPNITLEEAIPKLKTSIIREINEETSIRRGKYGDYIFYKKQNWKKPKFLKLNEFIDQHGPSSYISCDIELLKSSLLIISFEFGTFFKICDHTFITLSLSLIPRVIEPKVTY